MLHSGDTRCCNSLESLLSLTLQDFEDVEEDIAAPTPRTAAAPVPQPRPIPITRVASGPSAGAQMVRLTAVTLNICIASCTVLHGRC